MKSFKFFVSFLIIRDQFTIKLITSKSQYRNKNKSEKENQNRVKRSFFGKAFGQSVIYNPACIDIYQWNKEKNDPPNWFFHNFQQYDGVVNRNKGGPGILSSCFLEDFVHAVSIENITQ